jgi:3-oxoadipate enol-lactonase
METRNGFVTVEGGQLYYETTGQGKAILFIHAGVADHTMWDTQIAYFSPNYQVIRYDTRGFGRTTSENTAFSNRDDIRDLLNHLGIDQVCLVGISRGGQIATAFTLTYPEKVAVLVSVASGTGPDDFPVDETEMAQFNEMEKLEQSKDFEKLADLEAYVWVDGFYRKGKADPQVWQNVRQMILQNYQQHHHEELQPRPLDPPGNQRLHEIKVPTLVMIGGIDTKESVFMGEFFAKGVSGAKKVVFEDAAHMINLEKPAEFNQTLADFLKEVGY